MWFVATLFVIKVQFWLLTTIKCKIMYHNYEEVLILDSLIPRLLLYVTLKIRNGITRVLA